MWESGTSRILWRRRGRATHVRCAEEEEGEEDPGQRTWRGMLAWGGGESILGGSADHDKPLRRTGWRWEEPEPAGPGLGWDVDTDVQTQSKNTRTHGDWKLSWQRRQREAILGARVGRRQILLLIREGGVREEGQLAEKIEPAEGGTGSGSVGVQRRNSSRTGPREEWKASWGRRSSSVRHSSWRTLGGHMTAESAQARAKARTGDGRWGVQVGE